MGVEFEDNRVNVKAALNEAVIAFLYEAAGELRSQAELNTRRDKGDTANAWEYKVDEKNGEATVGNPLQNAIWEEFGTGEYALKGNGRKGGWYIAEEQLSDNAKSKMKKVYGKDGKVFYFTRGKKPNRALYRAFTSLKPALIRRAEEVLKERFRE